MSMLYELLDTIVNNNFTKFLVDLMWNIFYLSWGWLIEAMLLKIYVVWIYLLDFLWLLERIFDIFAGTTDIYLRDAKGVVSEDVDFVTAVFTGSQVQNAYWYFMLASVAICFLFTVFSIIRSMGDSLGEMRRPVTSVLRSASKAMVTFLLIPMSCLGMIKAATAITRAVLKAGTAGDTRICDTVFVLGVGDQFKSEEAKLLCSEGRYFTNALKSMACVNFRSINYIYAYVLTIFMIVVLMTVIMQAVMRIIVLATLFVVSPFFVSTIPLDDGEKFKGWTRLFTSFAVGTFGPIFVMRIFTVVLAMIGPGGGISFGTNVNAITNWILRMLIVMGGTFAAWRSQYIMLDLISPEASQLLQRSHFIQKAAKEVASKAVEAGAAYATGGASMAGKAAAGGGGGGGGMGGLGGLGGLGGGDGK